MKKLLLLAFISLLFPAFSYAQIVGNYEVIQGKVPPKAGSLDTIRIQEVFLFTCPHCNKFNPKMNKVRKKFGEKISFSAIPTGWQGDGPGKLYYIAKRKGMEDKTKTFIFNAAFDSGLGRQIYDDYILGLLAQQLGLYEDYQALKDDPSIAKEMEDGKKFLKAAGITGTPTIVIEGAIRVPGDDKNLIRFINSLLKNPVK